MADVFGLEPGDSARLHRLADDDRLKQRLRDVTDPAGRGEIIIRLATGMVTPGQQTPNLFTGQRCAEDVVAHQLLRHRLFNRVLFDPQFAKDFHRALVGDMGTGRVGQPAVLFDHDVGNAIARQQRGRCPACRTGSNDQHVRFNIKHSCHLTGQLCPAHADRRGHFHFLDGLGVVGHWRVRPDQPSSCREDRKIVSLLDPAPDPLGCYQHDEDRQRPQQHQVPGAIIGEPVLQKEQDQSTDDRPFQRADATDHDDEKAQRLSSRSRKNALCGVMEAF